MRRHARKALLAAVIAAIAGTVWVTVGTAASDRSSAAAKTGGTYRVGWEQSFGFTDNFDPTGEYLGNAWDLYSALLIRSLIGYYHVAGTKGNVLIGDLATNVPKATNGGKTYTYHIRKGVKFGPPVNRQVTSKDVAFAMQRLANPKDGGEYAFYYTIIKGWDAYAKNPAKAKTISGIKTPNASTIVFNLTEPTGDFNFRMSMPATGPIPPEVGKCFEGKAGGYGRDIVSSGPYMLQGADKVSLPCAKLKAMSGFDGQTHIFLVRNPNYDAKTDTKKARENNPDRFEWIVNSNADDIFNKVANGELEDEISSPSPKVLRKYSTDSSLKDQFHPGNIGDRTWYITMNLTQPPFDDVHVRKAMNWVMDKDSLRKGWGGPTAGSIATHIVPDILLNDKLKGYDPYRSGGFHGDAAKAQAEMKKSKYDTNHDGKCDASACKGLLMIADVRAVDNRMIPVIESSAAKIGIKFKVHAVNGAYPVIQTPSKNIPISERPGWGKDYADASTFFDALFGGASIIKSGNSNYSLVGLTPAKAKEVGVTGSIDNVPSIDPDISKCHKLSGGPRVSCWAALDKKLMEKVVPWVPYLSAANVDISGPKVAHWEYDQFADGPAYAHVALK